MQYNKEAPAFLQLMGYLAIFAILAGRPVSAKIRNYDFQIKEASYTRLCHTKNILTVNGEFPGPAIRAHIHETVSVRVRNHAEYNITLHWHGIDQLRNPWFDGPEYVTQCPIQPGDSFTYKVHITSEEGTVWWHAHSSWDRATVHGAIIIYPGRGASFPFPKPDKEIPIIIGEWWNGNISQVLADTLRTGGAPNQSDAFTINGQPGDLYNCSKPCIQFNHHSPGTYTTVVEHGKRYLLRVINAGLINEHFFGVAGHNLTVVGKDAAYTKPFAVEYIVITPGQTFDLLLEANQQDGGRYYITARPYASGMGVPFPNTTTTGILQYNNTPSSATPQFPHLPQFGDDASADAFTSQLRSLASKEHPIDVPKTVDERVVITIAMNLIACPPGLVCVGPGGTRAAASLNNISFEAPSIDILDAYYKGIKGVFGTGFPSMPPFTFNFTGNNSANPSLLSTEKKTEVKVFDYGKSVEVVFQGTSLLAPDNHPMHLHGRSFYVVGRGYGNFDAKKDPVSYNLVDPPFENTVNAPKNGWVAIRFKTLNPGVWFLHCHIEPHMSWGMSAVFIVKNGASPHTRMLPPPAYRPPC